MPNGVRPLDVVVPGWHGDYCETIGTAFAMIVRRDRTTLNRTDTMTLMQKYLKAEKYAQSLDASCYADVDAKKAAWAKANAIWAKIKSGKK